MMARSKVASERLTRQELGWLLAQEARSAAAALREGVTQLKQPVPAPEIREAEPASVETSLDALEDAVGMLSQLQTTRDRPGHLGRIDVAALLYRLAPQARIAMEPGAGTEVLGDENELARMLYVLVGQTGDPGAMAGLASPEIHVCREGDLVRLTVELGPDRSATADVEHRWLSRMAMRLGGRLDLEGGTQSLLLPAAAASEQREMAELRRELEQAQQQGEAYARELAEVLGSTGEILSHGAPPSDASPATRRFELLVRAAAALVRTWRGLFADLRSDALVASRELGESSDLARRLEQRARSGAELILDLVRLAECPIDERTSPLDLAAVTRDAVDGVAPRAVRLGVEIGIDLPATGTEAIRPATLTVLLRSLIDHAVLATPRGGRVTVLLRDRTVVVEDGGPAIPENLAADLLAHRVDPSALGRPSGLSLLVADAAAEQLGWRLTLGPGEAGRCAYRLLPPDA
jgi:hypothetical protein